MGKGWFGPKKLGWGISPRSWQGWLATLVLLLGVAASVRWIGPLVSERTGIDRIMTTPMIVAVWLALYGLLIWQTYDREA